MIEVILEADPNCPLCERAKRFLREAARDLNLPFTVRYYATRSVAASWGTPPVTQHLYDPDSPFASSLSKEAKEVLTVMKQEGLNLYPVIRVRWGIGKGKEVVIRGWLESEEYKAKLLALLTLVKELDS